MKNFFKIFIFSFITSILFAQTPSTIPLELRAQFNGRYDFTVIGNTFNLADTFDPSNPPCQLGTSSSAFLNLSPNQNIEAAYLYWSGIGDGTQQPSLNLNNNDILPDFLTVVDLDQNNFFFISVQ